MNKRLVRLAFLYAAIAFYVTTAAFYAPTVQHYLGLVLLGCPLFILASLETYGGKEEG